MAQYQPRHGRDDYSRVKRRRQLRSLGAVVVMALAAFACVASGDDDGGGERANADRAEDRGQAGGRTDAAGGGEAGTTTTTLPPLPPYDGFVNPASSGRPWSTKVDGLLTFRGNPTRTFYGRGPVPKDPEVLWTYPPDGGTMCGQSSVGGESKTWCGSGWTGQPSVWKAENGTTTVAFGAYDKAVHVIDGKTGGDVREPFPTGDIIKGSVTVDPDGFPLLYSGSRDDEFHVFALDRGLVLEELWTLPADAVSPTKWNDDWDGSALVIDDYLFVGGENSQFHIVKLNRGYGPDDKVTVDPELVFNTPGWDDELLSAIGDEQVSIENSVAISGNVVYFANSGGLVQGWDISGLKEGRDPTRVFRFWTGDDTDATIVIDGEGMLYVGSEYERGLERSREVGQLMKLDPSKPDDPLVWSVDDSDALPSGIWATPAIHDGVVYAPTDGGRLLAVDQQTGEMLWEKQLAGPTWQSPVVVDDVLIQGDCLGVLHGFDVSKPGVEPPEIWTVKLEGCIESTPAVWEGRIWVGARGGRFYAIGDPSA